MKKTYLANWAGAEIDLGVVEEVLYSAVDLGDGTYLVKVCALPSIHAKITATPKTDTQALEIFHSKHPNSEFMDTPDIEVDEILKGLGQNPNEIRRSSGNTLKDQEYGAMKKIADLKGKDISDLEDDIKAGKCEAHEKALKRLRK